MKTVTQMDICPSFKEFLHPLLLLASEGEVRVRSAADTIADRMNLSAEARREMKSGGGNNKYVDRTHWSATYLKKAGLLSASQRGYVSITEKGYSFLDSHKNGITLEDLYTIDAFREFKDTKKKVSLNKSDIAKTLPSLDEDLTPEEKISSALTEIEDSLISDILERIYQGPPSFFERVVVGLLVSMGYGNAGQAQVVGKSGDNGIDGVIDQDQLGLDRVYIQAKRYETDNKVGSDAIRNFAGSLNYHQASKGLFVTTSSFTSGAIDTAEKVNQRIVLIDGNRLARLMIANKVGCSPKRSVNIMKIDEDFFDY